MAGETSELEAGLSPKKDRKNERSRLQGRMGRSKEEREKRKEKEKGRRCI